MAQKAPNRWELVNQRGDYDEIERLRIPEGWLYRSIILPAAEGLPPVVNMVFVQENV